MAKADVVIKLKVKLTFWSAIKLRIAGLRRIVKEGRLAEILSTEIEELEGTGGMITAPLPTEPRPRSKHPPKGYNASPFSNEPDPRKRKGDPPRSFLVKQPDYPSNTPKNCPVCNRYMTHIFEAGKKGCWIGWRCSCGHSEKE